MFNLTIERSEFEKAGNEAAKRADLIGRMPPTDYGLATAFANAILQTFDRDNAAMIIAATYDSDEQTFSIRGIPSGTLRTITLVPAGC